MVNSIPASPMKVYLDNRGKHPSCTGRLVRTSRGYSKCTIPSLLPRFRLICLARGSFQQNSRKDHKTVNSVGFVSASNLVTETSLNNLSTACLGATLLFYNLWSAIEADSYWERPGTGVQLSSAPGLPLRSAPTCSQSM